MWIEINNCFIAVSITSVTPLAGVWIEMCRPSQSAMDAVSLPLRGCGLKSRQVKTGDRSTTSLPLRGCGLKFFYVAGNYPFQLVTPLAGGWIEMTGYQIDKDSLPCHSPCGGVD